MEVLRSTLEVARLLAVPEWRIEQSIRRGLIPAPPIVGGARVWTSELVELLRDALVLSGVHGATPTGTELRGA